MVLTMSSLVAFKCQCRQQIDAQNRERIVTEACGHSKCRDCFIKEESGCVKCLSSKTHDTQHQSASSDETQIKNVIANIQNKHVDHGDNETHRSISNPKDIRILEEVIIKPFEEIPMNECDSFAFPRMKEFKFKYPSHITWQVIDGKTEFECKICKKSFRSKSNRKYHLYCDDTVEKPFNCAKCSKTFATRNHLEYHESRHNNIQHNCHCGRKFLSRVSLQKHSKIHTNDFKFMCDHCNMKFHHKSDLVLHMYSHKKSPLPFQCDACDKSFAAKFKLNQHSETHKGVKSHACHCGKRFTRNSSLTIHMLTHSSSDTKYGCTLCTKSFDRQRSYDRHMKIKHGSTLFRCPLCDVQSGRRDNILRHIRNLHSAENFDEIIKKISKTVPRLKSPDILEPKSVTDVTVTDELTENRTTKVCQYQSVIQFAGRSKTPPLPPTQSIDVTVVKCVRDIEPVSHPIVSNKNNDDAIEANRRKSFSKELRVELAEADDGVQNIRNITIYRQLLSPYLRPPPNLDCRNGSQEHETYRGYQVQSDRLPVRKENVDIYRSILMSTTDQEPQTVIQNSDSGIVHWRKRTSQSFNQMEH